MPLGPIFDAEKKNLLAPPPKKSASNFCDLFQFTLSLIFTRPAAIWPFLVVFCFSTHTVHTALCGSCNGEWDMVFKAILSQSVTFTF